MYVVLKQLHVHKQNQILFSYQNLVFSILQQISINNNNDALALQITI